MSVLAYTLVITTAAASYFNPFATITFRYGFASDPVSLALENDGYFTYSYCTLVGNDLTAVLLSTTNPVDGDRLAIYRLKCNGKDFLTEPIKLESPSSSCHDILNHSNDHSSTVSQLVNQYCRKTRPTLALDSASHKFIRSLRNLTVPPELRSLASEDTAKFLQHVNTMYDDKRKRPVTFSLSLANHPSSVLNVELDGTYSEAEFNNNGRVSVASNAYASNGKGIRFSTSYRWYEFGEPEDQGNMTPNRLEEMITTKYLDVRALGAIIDPYLTLGGFGSNCAMHDFPMTGATEDMWRSGMHMEIRRDMHGIWDIYSLNCGYDHVADEETVRQMFESATPLAEELSDKLGVMLIGDQPVNAACLVMLPGMSAISFTRLCKPAGDQ